jgi:hypothetical protein
VAAAHRRLRQAAVVSIEHGMNDLFPLLGCRVEAITPDGPDLLHVDARATRLGGRCPDCKRASRAVHSRYRRYPADVPSLGRQVHVGLRVIPVTRCVGLANFSALLLGLKEACCAAASRYPSPRAALRGFFGPGGTSQKIGGSTQKLTGIRRFYCRNAKCARRTFAERLPELAAPHARQTARLAEAQSQVAAALGGEAAARMLRCLAMPASPDTVLRLTRRQPLSVPEPLRVVGMECADRVAAFSARSSPIWKCEWPRAATTLWRFGTRCRVVATRTVPRWCRSGWPRIGCGAAISVRIALPHLECSLGLTRCLI